VRYFLSNVRQQESVVKRGGGVVHLPVQDDIPQTDDDTVFDRDWARTTINHAIVLLGDAKETQMLVPWLTSEMTQEDRGRLAAELGKSESAVKVALHRLRKKFRQHVREQIAHTVETEKEIDAELDYLIRVLTRH
jgi:RNA polymerase sigma-70 factor (ECF subfamily)